MRESFFPLTLLAGDKPAQPKHPGCGECGLKNSCRRPMMKTSGEGKRKILVVAPGVGPDEENTGRHLGGPAGRHVAQVMDKYGVDLRRDCWSTSARICSTAGVKTPADVIRLCRPNLLNEVQRLKPDVIILLGVDAVKSLVGGVWRENVGSEERWAGYRIPHRGLNAWVCPTFDPSRLKDEKTPVMGLYLERHLAAALRLKGKPYDGKIESLEGRVVSIQDPVRAAGLVARYADRARTIAFDYETTTLKPDGPNAEIVCCSVSDGETAIAYPWVRKTAEATKRVLTNPKIRKIGSNIKFEDRWTRKHLGVEVANWFWDTVLGAHALENNTQEKEIASIKFQAFVHLGVDSWDEKVAPYLKSKGNEKLGNAPNRIKEVDLPTLLKYNALDSLYEFLVAKVQYATLKNLTKEEQL